jgi:CubicO group peptidase (beta-lactamase class C family)
MRFIALIVLCLFTFFQNAVGQNATSSTIEKTISPIDSFIEQRMTESGIVGLGAAIIVNKKVVWMKGYGYADQANQVPFTPNTIMNIASISKTFVGASIMHAVEDNKLSLDEDINNYLPFQVINPYYPNEKITIRNLATHTSSLQDRPSVYDKTYYYGGDSPVPLGEFLKAYFVPGGKHYSKKNFLNVKPGTYREYSNIAAGLAGYIVEVVTGEKLNIYSKRHIFDPLEMVKTGWFLSEIDLTNHSKQYDKKKNKLKTIPLYGQSTYPDGGVRSSVSEVSKFFIALLNEGEYQGVRILKKASVEEMLRFQFTEDNKPDNVNLKEPDKNSGIFWATKRDVTMIGHSGTDSGVKTEMLSNLSKDVAVILFSNTAYNDQVLNGHFAIYNELWKYGELIKDHR